MECLATANSGDYSKVGATRTLQEELRLLDRTRQGIWGHHSMWASKYTHNSCRLVGSTPPSPIYDMYSGITLASKTCSPGITARGPRINAMVIAALRPPTRKKNARQGLSRIDGNSAEREVQIDEPQFELPQMYASFTCRSS